MLLAVAGISATAVAGSASPRVRAGGKAVAPDTLSTGAIVSTSGPVVELAADGSRVAAAVGYTDRWCGHVVVWDVSRRKLVPLLPAHCSKPDDWSDVNEVALAGDRAAWIDQSGSGNTQYYYVGTATIAAARVQWLGGLCDLGEANSFCSNGGWGNWATNIVGHGDLLMFNNWSVCDEVKKCPSLRQVPSEDYEFVVDSGSLLRVTPARLRRVASGVQTLFAVSVDAGRILVLRSQPGAPWWSNKADGSLAIYRSDGHLVTTLTTTLGTIRDARLQGRHVAVLTGDTVAILDAATGRTLRTWPLQGTKNGRLEDIHNGIVVYVARRTIHLLRLRDGSQAAIAVPGRGSVRAQLEASGLFYSYGNHIAFIRFADLTRRFGK